MKSLTFRSSRIVYYGPHPCANCGINIVKAGDEFGGSSFTYPPGQIFPNSEWHPHFCDPKEVWKHRGQEAREDILERGYNAEAYAVGNLGYVIISGNEDDVISCNQTFGHTVWDAWMSAQERYQKGWPMWKLSPELRKMIRPYLTEELEGLKERNVPHT